jgi:uncharacterized membrane protein (DUF4010 family)
MLGSEFPWLAEQGLERLPEFLTALAIGLLIGLERERNPTAKAGLRTFALVSLFGAASAALADRFEYPVLVATGAVAVALMMIAAYFHDERIRTIPFTVIAVLHATSGSHDRSQVRAIAVMLAIGTTILLYFRPNCAALRHLERRDLISILQFAVVLSLSAPAAGPRVRPLRALNPPGSGSWWC